MRKFPAPSLLIGWLALMALLGANLAIAFAPLGPGSPAISLSIAAAQVAIVALVLMKLGRTAPLVRIFALCGIFWLLILFGLSGVDYATRSSPGFTASLAHVRPHRH
jgi:cytochrome c oxidase subunit 4